MPGYEILSPVGFGAAGAVWSARDPGGRGVVVAVVPLATGSRGAAQLRRLGRLRGGYHPHLAHVVDVAALEGARCAVVSEVVTGPSLATVHAARGALGAPEIASLLAAIGGALGYLHARGIVHADVSPTNVLLAPGGVPVLVDLVGEGAGERGTPGFVAPERAGGHAPGAPGDVWALARLLLWASGDDPAVAGLVAPGLDPDPAARPDARDLAALAPALADARPVVLPDPGALAQAQLRADAVHVPTQLARAGRPRRTHRRRRRLRGAVLTVAALGAGATFWVLGAADRAAPAASEAAGAVDVVPAGAVDRVGVPSTTAEPEAALASADADAVSTEAAVLEAVRGLLAARDRALAAPDGVLLASLTVPGSAPAAADAALLGRLSAAGIAVEGLRTEVSRAVVVERLRGAGSSPEAVVVDAWTVQGAHVVRASDGTRTEVPAQGERCTRMTLAGPPWQVSAVGSCA